MLHITVVLLLLLT